MAAATDDHTLGDLKWQIFVLLQLQRPQVPNPFHWVGVKVLAGAQFPGSL